MNFVLLNKFLTNLADNNNKAWFDANRPSYLELKADFEDLVGCILTEVAKFEESVGLVSPKDCIFRINRDVRFGNNKSPYKTHLSAVIGGKKSQNPDFYLELRATEIMLAGGLWIENPDNLKAVRTAMVAGPEKFLAVVEGKKLNQNFEIMDWDSLKTPARGYDKNAPGYNKIANYLKYKHFVFGKTSSLPTKAIPNVELAKMWAETFKILLPLNNYLKEVMWLVV